jgi:RNA polymerase sigma-70 factor (ECF subfamily)
MTDAAQFTATYRQHSLPIYRFALHMSGSETIADEVTQETFLVLIHQPGSFDAKRGTMGGFLYGVARNLVRRHLEQGRKLLCMDDADEEEYATGEDLLGDLTRRESIAALQEAVLCLPPKYREAVVLCDLQELSYEAAAAAVGCAVGTIRSRLHRARALLASKMQANELLASKTQARCLA